MRIGTQAHILTAWPQLRGKGDHLKSLSCSAQSLEQMVTDASSSSEKSICTSWCQTIILAVGVSGSSPFPALNLNLILRCEMFLCDKGTLSEGPRKIQTWKVEWKYQRILKLFLLLKNWYSSPLFTSCHENLPEDYWQDQRLGGNKRYLLNF